MWSMTTVRSRARGVGEEEWIAGCLDIWVFGFLEFDTHKKTATWAVFV